MKRGRSEAEGRLSGTPATASDEDVVEVSEAEQLEDLLRRTVGHLGEERASAARWREARRLLFTKAGLASDEVIIYVLRVLKQMASRAQISSDEWEACRRGAERICVGRDALLERMRQIDDEDEVEIVLPPTKRVRASPGTTPAPATTPTPVAAFQLLRVEGETEGAAHTIGLSDVVHAGCELAVVCNYMHDVEWLYTHAPALATMEKVLIVHGMDASAEGEWRKFVNEQGVGERVRFCRPRTPPYGTVHTKLWVLFYGVRGVRIFLTTANNVASDYLHKTQGGWMRDFPLANGGAADAFRDELSRYMAHAVKGAVGDELQRKLAMYDFRAADAHLVTSVPGAHRGADLYRYGHMRLRSLLQAEDIEEGGASRVVCQFSSLGSVRDAWLEGEFAGSLFASMSRKRSGRLSTDRDKIELVYPTLSQVVSSVEGPVAGLSLPVRMANLNRKHITSRLHRWEAAGSGRARHMPHIKTFARYEAHSPRRLAWCFLGSFNLSVAAWGRLSKAGDSLRILAYEAGVLLTPTSARPRRHAYNISAALAAPGGELPPLVDDAPCKLVTADAYWGAHEGEDDGAAVVQVPLPYSLPPKRYARADRAWAVDMEV